MLRPRWLVLALAAATGGPYLVHAWNEPTSALWQNLPDVSRAASSTPTSTAEPAATSTPTVGPPRRAVSPRGDQVPPLAELLRFDRSKAWVLGHWSRISTGLAELDLEGYRVTLVTGTGEGDLAGSLTYYFNPQQRVERITFRGTTGNGQPLAALLGAQYGFSRQLTENPSLFLYRPSDKSEVTGELRIKTAAVVHNDDPYSRFDVDLVMTRTPTRR